MAVFLGLVRRAAAEAERHVRGGLALLVKLGQDGRERDADLERLQAYGERISLLESTLQERDEELRVLRTDFDSLVTQLNDRLLPRIDERMDDTERDLTVVATTLVRTGKDTAGNSNRLENVERRVADLRGKLSRMEQRAGLWRELQGNMARLGDDIDALRGRLDVPSAERVGAEPISGQEAHH